MSRHTRRDFLEESIIAVGITAAAASSAPELIAEPSGRSSSNDTIRHAVIGCRIRGRVHAREFGRQDGVEVAYVCDPDEKLVEELANSVEEQQGRRPKTTRDLREIMDDKSIDTVSVAAPNHWHALAAIWAMQSGKDVYVEKPVSHNVTEGRRIVQVARKTGQICQSGTQRRSIGYLKSAAKFIQQGKLGEVTLARSIIYGRRGSIGERGKYEVPKHIDYNLWLGPAKLTALTRPNLHYDWHWDWNTGNGELGNNNIHYVDVCRMLMGITGLGDAVISAGGRLGYVDAGETPNTQVVAHVFGKQTIVQEVRGMKSDPFSKKFHAGWVIHGTEGFIAESSRFDLDGNKIETFEGPSENHFANFIKAVRSRKREELNADILEGHQSSALCHIANISNRLGEQASPADIIKQLKSRNLHEAVPDAFTRMISHLKDSGVNPEKTKIKIGPLLTIDSANEKFVDNADANALLSRSYRKPFVVPSEQEI